MKKYIFKMKGIILVQIFFSLLDTIAIATLPYLNMQLFDENISRGYSFLLRLFLLYFITIGCSAVFQYISQLYEWKVSKAFNIEIKKDIYASINKQSYLAFREQSIGGYISIMDNDIRALNTEYLAPVIDIVKAMIQLMVYAFFLVYFVDLRIAIVIIAASLTAVFIPKLTAKKIGNLKSRHLEQQGIYTNKLKDLLEGHKLVNGRTWPQLKKQHDEILMVTEEKKYLFGRFKTFTNVLNGTIMSFVTLSAMMIVGYLLYKGEITIGAGVATLGYVESFIYPIRYILDDINSINSAKEVKAKMIHFLEQEPFDAPKIMSFNQGITCENVSVTLGDFHLINFNYHFKKGNKYAIIGHSGSGKSTLLNAIANEVTLHSGKISLDDTCLASSDASHVMTYLHQHEHIFTDNIHNNVSVYASYDLIEDDLLKLIENAEDCTKLSGGEKQLVAYARSKASDTKILLMDEPFSALDKVKAKKVIQDLMTLDKTVIHVSHRLDQSLLEGYDAVLEMENGRLKELLLNTT